MAVGDRTGTLVEEGGRADNAVALYGKVTVDGDTPVAVDSTGRVLTSAAPAAPSTILNQTVTNGAAGTTASLNTGTVAGLAVDITLTSFTGGTAPTVTFIVDRLGSDGATWYPVWTSAAQTGPGAVSTSIGPGLATAQALTGTVRLRWTFGGTVQPTGVTFTASIVGR